MRLRNSSAVAHSTILTCLVPIAGIVVASAKEVPSRNPERRKLHENHAGVGLGRNSSALASVRSQGEVWMTPGGASGSLLRVHEAIPLTTS